MKKRERIREVWTEIYPFVIPTFFTILYWILAIFKMKFFIQDGNTDNQNIEGLLNGVITFVTIIMGIFGFLIPALVSNKKDSGMIEFFLNKADQKRFVKKLKLLVMSGMITVLLCLGIFLESMFKKCTFVVEISFLIWFLLYFVCNAYRFIGLILSLLILSKKTNDTEIKNAAGKQVESPMSEEQIKKLNESLTKKNNIS